MVHHNGRVQIHLTNFVNKKNVYQILSYGLHIIFLINVEKIKKQKA